MKKLKRSELLNENFSGTSLAGREKKEVKKAKVNPLELTPKISIALLLILGILVCSVAYYVTQAPVPRIENVNAASLNFVEPTIITTTTTTLTTITTTVKKRAFVPTTIQETTTTTTVEECGNNLQKPCEVGIEKKCDLGLVLNANSTCVTPTCAPSVPSGRSGCGGWALNYCRN